MKKSGPFKGIEPFYFIQEFQFPTIWLQQAGAPIVLDTMPNPSELFLSVQSIFGLGDALSLLAFTLPMTSARFTHNLPR